MFSCGKISLFLVESMIISFGKHFFNWNPFYYKAKKALNSKIKGYYALSPLEQ